MKNTGLIVLACMLFHAMHICSMESILDADEVQASADEQTREDVSSPVVPVKDKPPEEEHWYDLTVAGYRIPAGKVILGGVSLALIGGVGAGGNALGLWKSGEPEWAKLFRHFLDNVDEFNPGFREQWKNYVLYGRQNQAGNWIVDQNPYDLLKKDEFMSQLPDKAIREFLTILKQLDKDLWENKIRGICIQKSRKELLKELLKLEKREDVFQDPYVQRFEDWEQRSLMQLRVELNNHQILRDNVEWSL